MILSSEYMLTDKDGILGETAKQANNLYNACLYQVRQAFIKRGKINNYNYYDSLFKTKYRNRENMLYHKLGYVQSAQQTIKEVNTIWNAWLKALKAFRANPSKFSGKPHMPKYLPKAKKHSFFVTNQNAKVKNGYLVIKKLNIKVKLADNLGKLKQVTFKPLSRNRFKMLIQHEVPDVELRSDNGIYVGIDPGLDNAFTCVTNAPAKPLIINGKGVKSVNQYYNKRRALLSKKHAEYHQCCKEVHTKQGFKTIYYESQAMLEITDWRNNKIKQFAHKATKRIIDYALNCGANTIVIGSNKGLKRSSNMGKRNNQNFIGIPHQVMVNMLEYKAQLAGINVIKTRESYTSQTSFLDGEKPCKQNGNYARKQKGLSPAKRRVKRGLFKSNKGTYLLLSTKLSGADVGNTYIQEKILQKNGYKFKTGDLLQPQLDMTKDSSYEFMIDFQIFNDLVKVGHDETPDDDIICYHQVKVEYSDELHRNVISHYADGNPILVKGVPFTILPSEDPEKFKGHPGDIIDYAFYLHPGFKIEDVINRGIVRWKYPVENDYSDNTNTLAAPSEKTEPSQKKQKSNTIYKSNHQQLNLDLKGQSVLVLSDYARSEKLEEVIKSYNGKPTVTGGNNSNEQLPPMLEKLILGSDIAIICTDYMHHRVSQQVIDVLKEKDDAKYAVASSSSRTFIERALYRAENGLQAYETSGSDTIDYPIKK